MSRRRLAVSGQRHLPGFATAGDLVEREWRRRCAPERYEAPWRALRAACIAAGVGPDDLDGLSFAGSGMARVAVERGWSPATIALYTKVARYAGLAVPPVTTPEPVGLPLNLSLLWALSSHPSRDEVRGALIAAVGAHWPASPSRWLELRVSDVAADSAGLRVAGRHIPGAAELWERWLDARAFDVRAAGSPWVLCLLHSGRLATSRIGDPMSARGLQAAWGRHVRRTAARLVDGTRVTGAAEQWRQLSYDTYRRLLLARGVTPVETRGVVRATRARRTRLLEGG